MEQTPVTQMLKYLEDNDKLYRGMIIEKLKALLEEEKQFAKDAFEAGKDLIYEVGSNGRYSKSLPFDDYYLKYES